MAESNPIHLQKALKNDLIAKARHNAADDEVMTFLNELPDREFGGPNGVTKEISS